MMDIKTQHLYQQAIKFAASRHQEKKQIVPGTDLPYVVHLSNVAMEILVASAHTPEFNLPFAIQVALLHDTLEDTSATMEELSATFGAGVATAVSALTKNKSLPKDDRIADSLKRIKVSPKEVWAVKLADRITNLQPPPPHWDKEKISRYHEEAGLILEELGAGNEYLARRLKYAIVDYGKFGNVIM